MIGTNASTGKPLAGTAHLAQSIGDILSTPIGSRVMRRDYGSALFDLLDQPMNPLTRIRLFAATADALRRWEPRLRLTRVAVPPPDAPGSFALDIEGRRTDTPRPAATIRLTIPLAN